MRLKSNTRQGFRDAFSLDDLREAELPGTGPLKENKKLFRHNSWSFFTHEPTQPNNEETSATSDESGFSFDLDNEKESPVDLLPDDKADDKIARPMNHQKARLRTHTEHFNIKKRYFPNEFTHEEFPARTSMTYMDKFNPLGSQIPQRKTMRGSQS